MRTTLDIDNELMDGLLANNPGLSKKAAVELAIREYLGRDAYRIAESLVGKIKFDEEFMRDMRKNDRTL